MLIRFGVANHGSILDYAELSLVASTAIKDEGAQLLQSTAIRERLLPAVLVYGANASGKSTIYNSIRSLRQHVVNSFTTSQPDSSIPRNPFLLSSKGAELPSRFDCDFIVDGVRYHYGFEATDQEFVSEWMHSFPEGSRRTLYERDHGTIRFGKTLRGKNKLIETLMRKNSLFLSVAAQHAHPQLSRLYDFFSKGIVTLGSSINIDSIQQSVVDRIDDRLISFIKHADVGIVDARVESHRVDDDEAKLMERISTALKALVEDAGGNLIDPPKERKSVSFLHTTDGGEPVSLPLRSESRGTVRLLSLASKALDALDRGIVLVVDELDVSLHTLLAIELVGLFARESTNPRGAQLVATTHDTNLLCHNTLRRDQIWFAEKDNIGRTSIYPLTDIKTRNTDNIEKGYLQGRFGAVPFLGRMETLLPAEPTK